jgi:hypothetical protein
VEKNGEWVNYNLESVKAGMSPYFTKYGRSRRFHEEFVLAQQNARAQQLGIWNPEAEAYGDYDERLTWWNARGDTIWAFELEMETNNNYIALTRFDAMQELERRIDKPIVLLASVSEIKFPKSERGPIVVKLSRTRTSGFDVLFFKKDVFEKSKIGEAMGEFVRVRGKVRRQKSRNGLPGRLRLIVGHPDQVVVPASRLPGATDPENVPAPERQLEVEPELELEPEIDLQDAANEDSPAAESVQ